MWASRRGMDGEDAARKQAADAMRGSGEGKATRTESGWLSSATKRLDAEAGATAAGAFDRGVLELEAGGFEGLDVIDHAAIQVHGAGGVDEDFEVVELEHLVHHSGLVLKRHAVLEAGAAATDDTDAQTSGNGILRGHDLFNLADR